MSPAILVASPRQIGSMPVASGSRLPAWPAFSPAKSRRTRCSAPLEERPRGLSSSRIPLGMARAALRIAGARTPCGRAVGPVRSRLARRVGAVGGAIGGDRAVDETREARRALGALIEQELEARR